MISIRTATDDDRVWAAKLMAESEPWTSLGIGFDKCLANCRNSRHSLYVAETGGKAAGFILIDPAGLAGSPYIKSVAVEPAMRNMKIGELLVLHAEEVARGTSANIFLCVSSFNIAARRFYERLGFSKTGEIEDYIIKGASEIIMRKIL